jgi:hypothetical protein
MPRGSLLASSTAGGNIASHDPEIMKICEDCRAEQVSLLCAALEGHPDPFKDIGIVHIRDG